MEKAGEALLRWIRKRDVKSPVREEGKEQAINLRLKKLALREKKAEENK